MQTFKVIFTLLHSNAEGTTYWSRYLEGFNQKLHSCYQLALAQYKKVVSVSIKNIHSVEPGQTTELVIDQKKSGNGVDIRGVFSLPTNEGTREVAVVKLHLAHEYTSIDIEPLDKKSDGTAHWSTERVVADSMIDTNQCLHWIQCMHLIGEAREEFITHFIPDVMEQMKNGLLIITRETMANIVASRPSLGQNVRIVVGVKASLKLTSSWLVFSLYSNDGCFLQAKQQICFARMKNGNPRPCRIPNDFLEVAAHNACSGALRSLARIASKMVN